MLFRILALVAVICGGLVGVLLAACVGRTRLSAVLSDREERRRRLREILPYIGGLGAVLLVNKGLLGYSLMASKVLGIKATGWIYELEGEFVAWVQELFPAQAILYFSAIYVFGYVVLLVFPLLAYFFSERLRNLKVLLTSYAINYAVGVLCYTAFYVNGPRLMRPSMIEQPMYSVFPEVMYLTSMINYSSNVFPSLHTSLSLSAMILALMSRDEFPKWTPIATVLGVSVMIATMFLGIHWLTDVIAGIVLGSISVYAADYVVERTERALLRRRRRSRSSAQYSD